MTNRYRRAASLVLLLCIAILTGCQASPAPSPDGYDTMPTSAKRRVAEQANARAAVLIEEGELDAAVDLLKKALAADVMFGPAHNNLGKVYYHQNRLYLAAWEFQYAIKLMPYQAEPKNNLGLVFEKAGRLDQAVESYAQARDTAPDHAQFIGNLARARIKRGDRGPEVRELLQEIVLKDERRAWVTWAQEQLALTAWTENDYDFESRFDQ